MSEESKKRNTRKLSDIINANKPLYYSILGIVAVIFIVLIFGGIFNEEKKTAATSNNASAYAAELEDKLENILSKIEGAGKVSVAISLESGAETVLATEITVTETVNGTETVETPIIINGETVVLKELYPKIAGVLIVAEGANSISVLSRIQQAAVSLLDININQIEILTMR